MRRVDDFDAIPQILQHPEDVLLGLRMETPAGFVDEEEGSFCVDLVLLRIRLELEGEREEPLEALAALP